MELWSSFRGEFDRESTTEEKPLGSSVTRLRLVEGRKVFGFEVLIGFGVGFSCVSDSEVRGQSSLFTLPLLTQINQCFPSIGSLERTL